MKKIVKKTTVQHDAAYEKHLQTPERLKHFARSYKDATHGIEITEKEIFKR